MQLDHNGYLPVFLDSTHCDVHEIACTRNLDSPRDRMVVCDREYVDYAMPYKWNLSGIDFITRLKSNTTYITTEYDTDDVSEVESFRLSGLAAIVKSAFTKFLNPESFLPEFSFQDHVFNNRRGYF